MLSTVVSMPFQLTAEGNAPSEFCIFEPGDNPSEKGTFLFDALAAELVMSKYRERGVPMMMDYEHQSQVEPPIEAPAAAKQFVPEIRNGALWATDIVWTDRARSYLESGEYRLFSPAFAYKELDDGRLRVTKLINVALTNNPALHNIEPLMAASDKDKTMEETEELKAKLKASQAECSALKEEMASLTTKLAKLAKKVDDIDEDEMKASLSVRGEVKSITGKDDHREQVGVLRSLKLKADSADEAIAKLRDIEEKSRESEFVALLDAGHKDGKISPAQRKDFWEKKCRANDGKVSVEGLTMLKDFLPTAPVQINLRESAQKAGAAGAQSAQEKSVLLRMGITSPEEQERFQNFRLGSLSGG